MHHDFVENEIVPLLQVGIETVFLKFGKPNVFYENLWFDNPIIVFLGTYGNISSANLL